MTSIAVVINPIAGGGRGKKVWRVLEPGLNALFSTVTYRMSNRVNDLELITAGLLQENPDYLLIIGGRWYLKPCVEWAHLRRQSSLCSSQDGYHRAFGIRTNSDRVRWRERRAIARKIFDFE